MDLVERLIRALLLVGTAFFIIFIAALFYGWIMQVFDSVRMNRKRPPQGPES